jgi:hypothetical protein
LVPERYHNAAVVTQQYKLVITPGTFGDESLGGREPVFELYDLRTDPGESRDVGDAHPQRVAALRAAYDGWYDDVRATRNFVPGQIVIDSQQGRSTHLCRYQDGTFAGGFSQGWSVSITTGGDYRLRVVRAADKPGHVFVRWLGKTTSYPSNNGTATARLSAGEGMLDIWFAAEGGQRERPGDNSTIGDVVIER